MFLKSYVELTMPFDEVRAAMDRRPRPWLNGLADAAERDGKRLLVDVGLELHGHDVSRRACLEVGEPVTAGRVSSLPFRLQVEGSQLFPSLEGTLDAAWLGPDRTQVAIAAQYDPPLGVLGRAVDRALLHRVAEAVAQHFLETVAERLASRLTAAGGPAP